MKKASWVIVLLGVAVLVMIPAMAGAQAENYAVVIKDTSCLVLDYNPSLMNPPPTFEVFDSVKVITQSRNLNKNVSCHGDLSDNLLSDTAPPPKAVTYDYDNTEWKCCVNFNGDWLATLEWHETITPSGNVSLTCHFKGGEPVLPCCPTGYNFQSSTGECVRAL